MATRQVLELMRRIDGEFPAAEHPPSVTLRGGNALDEYGTVTPHDTELDRVTDDYIEQYHWGLHFLDPPSWRYYLPVFMVYGVSRMAAGSSAALDTFLFSLRPPDRDPPRFRTLSSRQHAVVVQFLELLGFADESRYQQEALVALQEYWADGPSR